MVHPSRSLGTSKLHQRLLPKHSLIASVRTQSPKKHTPAAGSRTSRTAFYPEQMCGLIAKALYPKVCRTPVQAMPVVPVTQQAEHRVKEQSLEQMTSFFSLNQTLKQKGLLRNSLMSKVYLLPLSACPPRLSRQKRMQWSLNSCPVLQEATGLQDIGVWDSSTARRRLRSQLKRDSLTSRCTLVSS